MDHLVHSGIDADTGFRQAALMELRATARLLHDVGKLEGQEAIKRVAQHSQVLLPLETHIFHLTHTSGSIAMIYPCTYPSIAVAPPSHVTVVALAHLGRLANIEKAKEHLLAMQPAFSRAFATEKLVYLLEPSQAVP